MMTYQTNEQWQKRKRRNQIKAINHQAAIEEVWRRHARPQDYAREDLQERGIEAAHSWHALHPKG